MRNSNDTIGNRTRVLPACSAVPQPTAPPRAPYPIVRKRKIFLALQNIHTLYSKLQLKQGSVVISVVQARCFPLLS
jgi:hypothetical protein